MPTVLDELRQRKLIAIVRGLPAAGILDLASALLAGGISCVEVTFNQSAADGHKETLSSIAALARRFQGKLLVGAGTVLTPGQVAAARDAGAEYIISPDVNEQVISLTKALGLVSLPGALTPTEIVAAHRAGADMVKVFPAAQLGPGYIKAVRGPLSHIPLLAVGGVSPENLPEFIAAGAVGAGVGGNLVSPDLVKAGRFNEITTLAGRYAAALAATTGNGIAASP